MKSREVFMLTLIVILSIMLYKNDLEMMRYKNLSHQLEETVDNIEEELVATRIKMNDSVSLFQAEIKSLNMTSNNLKKRYDKLLKASKTKSKEVKSLTQVKTEIHHVDTVYAVTQPFNGLRAVLNDDFVKINVDVFSDRRTIIDYRIRDSLTVMHIQKRRSILFGLITWKKHKGIRVINHNPKASIVSVESVDVIE